jgi:hypothetical protein
MKTFRTFKIQRSKLQIIFHSPELFASGVNQNKKAADNRGF